MKFWYSNLLRLPIKTCGFKNINSLSYWTNTWNNPLTLVRNIYIYFLYWTENPVFSRCLATMYFHSFLLSYGSKLPWNFVFSSLWRSSDWLFLASQNPLNNCMIPPVVCEPCNVSKPCRTSAFSSPRSCSSAEPDYMNFMLYWVKAWTLDHQIRR